MKKDIINQKTEPVLANGTPLSWSLQNIYQSMIEAEQEWGIDYYIEWTPEGSHVFQQWGHPKTLEELKAELFYQVDPDAR